MSFEDDLENQCQARLLNEYYRQEFKEYIDDDDEVHWKPVAKNIVKIIIMKPVVFFL